MKVLVGMEEGFIEMDHAIGSVRGEYCFSPCFSLDEQVIGRLQAAGGGVRQ